MARDEGRLIEGYEAPIHQALWTRIKTMGVPRLWFIVWLIVCVYLAFVAYTKLQNFMAIVPLVVWVIGHVGLIALTRWDEHFDSVLFSSMRYRSRYDAG